MDMRIVLVGIVFLIATVLALFAPTGAPVVTTTTNVTGTLTQGIVAEHVSPDDCWTIIEGKVYDVTSYIPRHPGGRAEAIRVCGTDGTALFTTSTGRTHSQNAHRILEAYYVGDLDGAVVATPTASPVGTLDEELKAQYPGATIIEQHTEDDGDVEGVMRWRGDTYEFEYEHGTLEVKQ